MSERRNVRGRLQRLACLDAQENNKQEKKAAVGLNDGVSQGTVLVLHFSSVLTHFLVFSSSHKAFDTVC